MGQNHPGALFLGGLVERLYVVCDEGLPTGHQVAQSGHALVAFALGHPELVRAWHEGSNNLVCLQAPELEEVAAGLERRGLTVVRFHEPDLDGQLTAICAEPAARRHLRRYRLAGATRPLPLLA